MSDLKQLNGTFRRIYRDKPGTYGIELIEVVNGKITSVFKDEPTFPTVALHKYGKISFDEALKAFDKASQQNV